MRVEVKLNEDLLNGDVPDWASLRFSKSLPPSPLGNTLSRPDRSGVALFFSGKVDLHNFRITEAPSASYRIRKSTKWLPAYQSYLLALSLLNGSRSASKTQAQATAEKGDSHGERFLSTSDASYSFSCLDKINYQLLFAFYRLKAKVTNIE